MEEAKYLEEAILAGAVIIGLGLLGVGVEISKAVDKLGDIQDKLSEIASHLNRLSQRD